MRDHLIALPWLIALSLGIAILAECALYRIALFLAHGVRSDLEAYDPVNETPIRGLSGARRGLAWSIRAAAVVLLAGYTLQALSGLSWGGAGLAIIAGSALLASVYSDLEERIIPDGMSGVAMWCGLLGATFGLTSISIQEAMAGAAGGYAFLWIHHQALSRGGNSNALGLGDAKLLAAAGAWIGCSGLAFTFFLSASLAVITWAILRSDRGIPFGPGITLSALLCLSLPDWVQRFWPPL